MLRDFKPEISKLAAYEDWTYDEAVAQLSAYYDGYHFSRRNMVDVFNPFSLITDQRAGRFRLEELLGLVRRHHLASKVCG